VLPSAASAKPAGQKLEPIEVATFRRDGGYSDGRRPDSVEYTDAREDALRRDFTINGMFFDPIENQIIDYVGGHEDLKSGVIRAIGDPAQRIEEDKLRMLRGARFAATLEFSIEANTLRAIQQEAHKISVVSGERIGSELQRMLGHCNKVVAAEQLVETDLLRHILPSDLSPNVEQIRSQGIAQLKRLSSHQFEPAVVTLLQSALGGGQDIQSAKRSAAQLQRAWRLTNEQCAVIAWMHGHWKQLHEADRLPWPTIQRLLIHRSAVQAVEVAEAVAGPSDGTKFCRQRLKWPTERLNPAPLLDGKALIDRGIHPGPAFKQVLNAVRDAQLNGEIETSDSAVQLALELLEQDS
jgi:tRNA nucleotidyltransferase (CCA-adding enzyme)